jgi:uncharacterized RDD family membrane protein YckC
VIEREDLGSWLEGPPVEEGYVKGARLGLPAEGHGSVAPVGRRFLSLCIDWALIAVLSHVLLHDDPSGTLILFAAENLLLITLFGVTVGQFIMRIGVRSVRGRMPMVLRALIRSVLLVLVVPSMFWNKDGQPLQDVAAGTAVVRL